MDANKCFFSQPLKPFKDNKLYTVDSVNLSEDHPTHLATSVHITAIFSYYYSLKSCLNCAEVRYFPTGSREQAT